MGCTELWTLAFAHVGYCVSPRVVLRWSTWGAALVYVWYTEPLVLALVHAGYTELWAHALVHERYCVSPRDVYSTIPFWSVHVAYYACLVAYRVSPCGFLC